MFFPYYTILARRLQGRRAIIYKNVTASRSRNRRPPHILTLNPYIERKVWHEDRGSAFPRHRRTDFAQGVQNPQGKEALTPQKGGCPTRKGGLRLLFYVQNRVLSGFSTNLQNIHLYALAFFS